MTHALAARFATITTTAADRLRDRREAGQNSLEYLGMALLAGVVLAAIFGIINTGAISGKISEAWSKITSAS